MSRNVQFYFPPQAILFIFRKSTIFCIVEEIFPKPKNGNLYLKFCNNDVIMT